jgi:hypothetical protein
LNKQINEDGHLLSCCTVYSGGSLLTFHKNLLLLKCR